MKFHEKSLELNITHELMNLADSWYWFLLDMPLWRYWMPRYKLPFLRRPKSIAGGFHITTEGNSDPTGEAGGGFDVRIKSGEHLLFIQYKMGELLTSSRNSSSIFQQPPTEHLKFEINSTKTNQHFLLEELSNGVGAKSGNAVVYAFPMIADMDELEQHAGRLVRRTKFVSVPDINRIAAICGAPFQKNVEHSFRICRRDFNRCEVNLLLFLYTREDISVDIIADVILLGFRRILAYLIPEIINANSVYRLYNGYLAEGLRRCFGEYLRYLLHYFEVSPSKLDGRSRRLLQRFVEIDFLENEFSIYQNDTRDIAIIAAIFAGFDKFSDFIENMFEDDELQKVKSIPYYDPSVFIKGNGNNGIFVSFGTEYSREVIEGVSYLVI